jgi:hypothetical protein
MQCMGFGLSGPSFVSLVCGGAYGAAGAASAGEGWGSSEGAEQDLAILEGALEVAPSRVSAYLTETRP